MNKIHVLPPLLINQIAAGECIERPASIVKELVENSIDAQANSIKIDIEEGGTRLIRITDNGCGMSPEDLPLAITSHATSKLQKVEDLLSIHTLGFRGEALASIASVADIIISSCETDKTNGFKIRSQGGEVSALEPTAMNPGTIIEVHELFFNVPARRKFLKKNATEMGYVTDTVIKLAISRPDISFKLTNSGKSTLQLESVLNMSKRLEKILNIEEEKFLEVNHERSGIKITGFVAPPEITRPNSKQQFFYINDRSLKDKVISRALTDAYSDYLAPKRHSVAVLFLEIEPEDIDVNVHPTKAEIRYRDGSGVYGAVYHAILESLRKKDLTHSIPLFKKEENITSQSIPHIFSKPPSVKLDESLNVKESHLHLSEKNVDYTSEMLKESESFVKEESLPEYFPEETLQKKLEFPVYNEPIKHVHVKKEEAQLPETIEEVNFFSQKLTNVPLRWFQVHDSYIIIETSEGIEIIDQHALHERIIYARLKDQVRKQKVMSQMLLFPINVRLTGAEMATFNTWRKDLQEVGIEAEILGDDAVIRSLPQLVGNVNGEDLFRELLDQLENKKQISFTDILDHLLETMACKAAIKAGDELNPSEIVSLLERRESADNPFHCPHGRPTTLKMTLRELEKHFKRR